MELTTLIRTIEVINYTILFTGLGLIVIGIVLKVIALFQSVDKLNSPESQKNKKHDLNKLSTILMWIGAGLVVLSIILSF